jgi:uncharacterized protein (DUF952 family)
MGITQPDFVYRLATATEWDAAMLGGVVPSRDIDKRDGYMHLSLRDQVLETARLHFAGTPDLLVLEIPFAPVASLVKFELAPKRGSRFPHFYGALTAKHVARAIRLDPDGDSFIFGEAL